jgi:sterol desaturase/sphingolipid hydroxylase (fatty acid hydroxylase superfamily)
MLLQKCIRHYKITIWWYFLCVFVYVIELVYWFLVWMLWAYWFHRLAHIPSTRNPLWQIHLAHHKEKYGLEEPISWWPHWTAFLLWFGNLRASLDVWLTLTLPVVLLSFIVPQYGLPLLAFNYVYEVFLSEKTWDHNPQVKGWITRYLACGVYHLSHHRRTEVNLAFYVTIWDYVFGTVKRSEVAERDHVDSKAYCMSTQNRMLFN